MDDLISQLPDDILVSIISRIPTKEALHTRTLSKRWSYLFQLMPSFRLKLMCGLLRPSNEIIDGVHRALQRHSVNIRSFYIRCCLTESCTHTLEQCIYSLGDLGIEKLTLESFLHYPCPDFDFPFSCHLLSHMPSLKYFKLKWFSLQLNLKSQCNSLTTLRLSNIRAPLGSLECILSNCLSLRTLTIKMCKVPSKLFFCGPNLQLKCIALLDCGEALEEIVFEAPNLTTFDFEGYEIINFIFNHVPQLQTIYISSYHGDMPNFYQRLREKLPHLKTLLLDDCRDLYQDGGIDVGVNMFHNLKRLELALSYKHSLNMFSLTSVLHACPRLQEFLLSTMIVIYEWPEEEKNIVSHSHLKYVELTGFGGSDVEVGFASYILKSATVLEEMFISWLSSIYVGLGEWGEGYFPQRSKQWSQVCETIQQMKHQAVSKTAQVVFQKPPRVKPKQF
ncbi:hypothetical protein CASFOL_001039 [Castilleja foliolosa]|uniref:F-box domain-containing protein n=1 Tax=Castilleja foliolosa TaxID=1961234 RepID=A0ABD3ELE3_9LAMI